ncbi:hypothetical protein [Nocardia sp. NPDC057440]|uniref:hypothetical protein n=1 Tax=Nocardia sp. NPDC057440 TaxID=3346134 RepID=UPI00366B1AE4
MNRRPDLPTDGDVHTAVNRRIETTGKPPVRTLAERVRTSVPLPGKADVIVSMVAEVQDLLAAPGANFATRPKRA